MTAKKSTLAQTLAVAAGKTQAEAPAERASKTSERKPGSVLIAAHYDREVRRVLKLIEADTDRNLRQLLGEAINDLAAKYGKPQPFHEEA